MLPTPEALGGSLLKIYFSGRNDRNQSHIGWATIDVEEPEHIIDVSPEPVLRPGGLGCFDDNGVSPSCVVKDEDRTLLYYIGWTPGSTVRMHLFGGLALSVDGGRTFQRYSRAPIIERCMNNPFLNTAPMVLRDRSGWRMYYVAGTEWRHRDLPRYNIQYAESKDGIGWRREGHVAVPFKSDEENALARPFVLREGNLYRMWFAHKSGGNGKYRMGYAESYDGINWVRDDEFGGLDVSSSGFDSDMMEYFCVFSYGGRKYLFYNGNSYGHDGIGLAVQR